MAHLSICMRDVEGPAVEQRVHIGAQPLNDADKLRVHIHHNLWLLIHSSKCLRGR